MKKFINRPEDVVEEMLEGMTLLHPGLVRLSGHKVMLRADAAESSERQVALISGGGSGHEPAHAGYVGAGMLSAAVAGEVFTSPSSDSVYAAIKAVAGGPGAVLIVKNYTGDRLNFGFAAELARAEGIQVELLFVDDDVALKDKEHATGARGLAGTVFIHKLMGGAAAEGKPLAELVQLGRAAVGALATMGVSFSAGTSPSVGKPSFELAEDEMELGLGIHGEPGVRRSKILSANELTETLLAEILRHADFGAHGRVALMINNLGATTEMELAIVARHAVPFLERKGLTVERAYAGTFLSSLDMAGISISVLGLDDDRLRWLDAATSAPAWPNVVHRRPGGTASVQMAVSETATRARTAPTTAVRHGTVIGKMIESAAKALISAEAELTEMDRITGDGDLGASMARASRALLAELDGYPLNDAAATLKALGDSLRRELGGSSGPLYGVLFLRAGTVLAESKTQDLNAWARALEEATQAISHLGGAKAGDRTMLDALLPFVDALKAGIGHAPMQVLNNAVEAAEEGAAATAQMQPRLGRSSYLGERVIGHPDPGAMAVAIWLRAAVEAI